MVRDPSESSTHYASCKYGFITHSCSLWAVTAFLCDGQVSLAAVLPWVGKQGYGSDNSTAAVTDVTDTLLWLNNSIDVRKFKLNTIILH